MYLLVNSSTPFRLCNIFAFFYFLDEVLYSVVDRKKIYAWCRIPNHLDTHPKTISRLIPVVSIIFCG